MEEVIELSPEAFKWVYDFVDIAVLSGFTNHSCTITEDICNELFRYNLIERDRDNDGDCAWHGRVKLVISFVSDLIVGMNIYGLVRSTIYEFMVKEKIRQSLKLYERGEKMNGTMGKLADFKQSFISEEERALYLRAIAAWGVEAQINMFVEEVGELLSVLGKYRRGRVGPFRVAEELVDLRIMVGQVAVLLDLDLKQQADDSEFNYSGDVKRRGSEDLRRRMRCKLDRLEQLLDEAEEDTNTKGDENGQGRCESIRGNGRASEAGSVGK